MERSNLGAITSAVLAAGAVTLCWWMRSEKLAQGDALASPPRVWDPYRLAIKLGTDREAKTVRPEPQTITLGELLHLGNAVSAGRIEPLETTRWKVIVTVDRITQEPDGDSVLQIIKGGARSTAELPDVSLCGGSAFAAEMRAATQRLATAPKLPCRAEIVGVGFAGLPTADNPTGIKLYPLLSVRWLSGSAK